MPRRQSRGGNESNEWKRVDFKTRKAVPTSRWKLGRREQQGDQSLEVSGPGCASGFAQDGRISGKPVGWRAESGCREIGFSLPVMAGVPVWKLNP